MSMHLANKPPADAITFKQAKDLASEREAAEEEAAKRQREEGGVDQLLDEKVSREFYDILLPEVGKPTQRHSRDSLYKALRAVMRTFKVMFRNVKSEREIMEG